MTLPFSVTPWTDLSLYKGGRGGVTCWTTSLIRYFHIISSDARRQKPLS